ncbi:hypothetical protein R1flu_024794 [Riccia fluitans]|uniref:Uncharacterized protein n=1 Tax=Riccia fluitans TaxID=41844 RepID=A0ABD1XVX8_9MARC
MVKRVEEMQGQSNNYHGSLKTNWRELTQNIIDLVGVGEISALCQEQVPSSKDNPFVHNKDTSATKPTTTADVSFVGAQVKAEQECIVAPTLKTIEFE